MGVDLEFDVRGALSEYIEFYWDCGLRLEEIEEVSFRHHYFKLFLSLITCVLRKCNNFLLFARWGAANLPDFDL